MTLKRPVVLLSMPSWGGWGAAAAGVGAVAWCNVTLGRAFSAVPLRLAVLIAVVAVIAASGAFTALLRRRAMVADSDPSTEAIIWATAFMLGALVAASIYQSVPPVPDYARATVGLSDGRWPAPWRAFGLAVLTMGGVAGLGTAALWHRSGVRLSIPGGVVVVIVWTFAWALLAFGVVLSTAMGSTATAAIGRWNAVIEVPFLAIATVGGSAAFGCVAGWIAESTIESLSR